MCEKLFVRLGAVYVRVQMLLIHGSLLLKSGFFAYYFNCDDIESIMK